MNGNRFSNNNNDSGSNIVNPDYNPDLEDNGLDEEELDFDNFDGAESGVDDSAMPKSSGQREFEDRVRNFDETIGKNADINKKAKEAKANKDNAKQGYKDAKQDLKTAMDDKNSDFRYKNSNERYHNKELAQEENKNKRYNKALADKNEKKKQYKQAKKDNRKARNAKIANNYNRFKAAKYAMENSQDAGEFAKEVLKNETENQIRQQIGKKMAERAEKKAAKKAAKKASKKAAKKSTEAIAKKALSKKVGIYIAIGVGVVLLVGIIAIAIYSAIVAVGGISNEENYNVYYDIEGIDSNTQVEILNYDSSVGGYVEYKKVSIEDYATGVAVYEVGADSSDEVLKAAIIAARSYILAHNDSSLGTGLDQTNNIIKITNNGKEKIYWDYTKNLYLDSDSNYISLSDEEIKNDSNATNVSLDEANSSNYVATSLTNYNKNHDNYVNLANETSKGLTLQKKALSKATVNKIRTTATSVVGMYAKNSEGKPIEINLTSSDIESMKQQALTNEGSENGNYTALLMKQSPDTKSIGEPQVELKFDGDIGEYSQWKQKTKLGAPWGKVLLGSSSETSINNIGCLVTSISMQIAHSGVSTGTIKSFNPGTFAQAIKKAGCLSSGGGVNSYTCISNVIPNFQYVGDKYLSGSKSERAQAIKGQALKGYYIVIEVRRHGGGQHWVALDVQNSALNDWKEIYMWDPATKKVKISDASNYQANRLVMYKKS